jgi:cell division transport system ATP-binding protein
VVFQDFKLLPQKTVYENVAFALEVCGAEPKEIHDKVPRILDLVGMLKRRDNLPDELSGGERQRVSIARALVHSPKILIADEPTGNLDPVNAWEIIDLLSRINSRGTIVILMTHNKAIVDRLKRRVVLLKNGKVLSDKVKGGYII